MKDKPTKLHAVSALVGGQISTSDYENFEYNSGQTPPSEEAIEAKLKELMTEWDGLQEFQRNRLDEYPSIQECIHAILDDDLTALQTKRKLIKEKFPKPEQA